MNKVDHISPLVELDGLEEKVIKDVGLDQKKEKEKEDLRCEIEKEEEEDIEEEKDIEEEEEEEKEDDEDEDAYTDLLLNPEVTSWIKADTGETVHGVRVMDVSLSTDYQRYEFDLCPICVKPLTLDKIHQMSSLPCGHMFGMSCLKKWIKDRPSDNCPQCFQNFSLESVRPLYAPRLSIPLAAHENVINLFVNTNLFVDHKSLLELDEAEKEVLEAMELDFDDNYDDDFEKVEDLTLPLISTWNLPDGGPQVKGLEVPVMKDDEFIPDSMYRNDIDIDDDDDDPPLPPHVFDPLPLPPAPVCSICFKRWTPIHHFCSLPCGHIFGSRCITKWLRTNLCGTCPQCKALCSMKDVKPLYTTALCIPEADKGVADPEMSTRRFPYSRSGFAKFRQLESGRRNFALKKRSDAKKRLAGVVGRKNDLLKRRTDLLDRRANVLNRAKALDQRGGSLCRVNALRLRADALGWWADKYLERAKACEGRAEALGQRARAYNQRVKAFEERLLYFRQTYDNPTHCAAAATCHKN